MCNKMRVMESQAVGENRVEGVGHWACNVETGEQRRRREGEEGRVQK